MLYSTALFGKVRGPTQKIKGDCPVTLFIEQIQEINYDRLQNSSLLGWHTAAYDAANVQSYSAGHVL